MEIEVPLSGLKLSTIGELSPGEFFLLDDDALRLRVTMNDPRIPMAFIHAGTFALNVLRTDTRPVAVRVPTVALVLRIEGDQERDKYVPGVIHVTPEGPMLVVSIPGFGGSAEIAYLSLATWEMSREHPMDASAYGHWKIIDRSGNRDTVMASR